MEFLFVTIFIVGVLAYLQHRLAIIYEFEYINGPVILLNEQSIRKYNSPHFNHHLVLVTTKETSHYFKNTCNIQGVKRIEAKVHH
jgi:hypothetical protein